MNPLELKAHALNYRLYGKEKPDPELVESIQKHGVLEYLTILKDGTIISGHRRWRAALACEPMPKNIPCKVVGYANDLEEQEAVIEYNRQRRKTFEQLMNECTQLERIYKAQAKENSLKNLKQYKDKVKSEFEKQERIFPEEKVQVEPVKDGLEVLDKIKNAAPAVDTNSKTIPKKRVAEVAAEHANMSRKTYERGKKVMVAKTSDDPIVKKVAVEEVEKLNNNETSINAAHKRVQSAKGSKGRPTGSKAEGLPEGTVKRMVQTNLDFFETKVSQVSDKAAKILREHLEGETKRVTIKAFKTAEREGRKTIKESDVRKALDLPAYEKK